MPIHYTLWVLRLSTNKMCTTRMFLVFEWQCSSRFDVFMAYFSDNFLKIVSLNLGFYLQNDNYLASEWIVTCPKRNFSHLMIYAFISYNILKYFLRFNFFFATGF